MRISKKMMLFFLALLSFAALVMPMREALAAFSQGDKGKEVAAIQQKLIDEGYNVGEIDGIFGVKMAEAVKLFQKERGLDVDGIVGKETYIKLMAAELPKSRQATLTSRGMSGFVRNLISKAFQYIGVPYVFGGTSTWGIDCSGFTQRVFSEMGIMLPRAADTQYHSASKISESELEAGDLVFFETYEPGPSHCGIYIGAGQFIHAGSSTGVTVASLSDEYWAERYWGAGRVF